jgi:hypothetical protein
MDLVPPNFKIDDFTVNRFKIFENKKYVKTRMNSDQTGEEFFENQSIIQSNQSITRSNRPNFRFLKILCSFHVRIFSVFTKNSTNSPLPNFKEPPNFETLPPYHIDQWSVLTSLVLEQKQSKMNRFLPKIPLIHHFWILKNRRILKHWPVPHQPVIRAYLFGTWTKAKQNESQWPIIPHRSTSFF